MELRPGDVVSSEAGHPWFVYGNPVCGLFATNAAGTSLPVGDAIRRYGPLKLAHRPTAVPTEIEEHA
ncbi:hypothetical protein [Streptosporangium sp. NPDC051022]|uniref:hypothetical protein n=1 Tax=Streptosporangium sp. NPDC051022 TaxID=3155752 RepID=UPI0034393AFD